MNLKQLGWAALLIVVVGGVAWGLSFVPAPQGAAPEQHLLAGAATTTVGGPAFEYTEEHPYYTIDAVYPDTHNAAEQTTIEQALKSEIDDYAQNVADLDPSIMPSLGQGYKLALSIDYKKFSGADGTTSYLFTVYSDTGGAHPNSYFKTLVFDRSGRTLTVTDIVGTSTLPKLAQLVTADVAAQIQQRLGQSDTSGALFAEGLAPTVENFSNVVIDGSDLVVELPPYQVAAYAMGSFEVRVPLSEINK